MADDTTLKIGLEQLGFSQSVIEESVEKLTLYAQELADANPAYGLSAIRDYNEIIVRHILDSLAAYPELVRLKDDILRTSTVQNDLDIGREANSCAHARIFSIADIGSGGGAPGIPLAIIMSDTNFVLVERMSKRCAFLEHCIERLQLKNVQVENLELERIAQNRFDIAILRAFRPLDKKISRFLLRILKDDGKLVAYKAKKEKILNEMTAIVAFVPHYTLVKLSVPFLEDHERHLVIIDRKNH